MPSRTVPASAAAPATAPAVPDSATAAPTSRARTVRGAIAARTPAAAQDADTASAIGTGFRAALTGRSGRAARR
ncbi:hypothetical protein K8Z49_18285 [Actinomadura madurae]|uniref:hypothetical protein n=1 Tax=Actinomadura madurae TaxID=1993 RepID=UPI00399A29D1